MRILKLAVKCERWNLAAHTIVLAAARELGEGGNKNNDDERKAKKRRAKR
jgi:hypothetical protein